VGVDVRAPKIKFCGITDRADAAAAVAAGAWAIGVVLWSRSPRACEPEVAAEIAAEFRRKVEIAGVFVNPTLDEVFAAADTIGLSMLQFHGDEGPAFCAEAARRTGCKVIKAGRIRDRSDIQALATWHTDYHLLDSHVAGRRGGTGASFDWELVRAGGRRRGAVPVILSGGLTPENVADAILIAQPFAVDVASGVEVKSSHPPRKDHAKLEAFAAAVRGESAGADSLRSSPGAELRGAATQ
jgi:phosphoribosylanthranilate isomerase